jgi:DNA-binding CsgD family transcriptional regulator
MNTSSSIRNLFHDLSLSQESTSWLLLNPQLARRSVWNAQGEEISPAQPQAVSTLLSSSPICRHPVTGRVAWVGDLSCAVLGPCRESEQDYVIPFHTGGALIALLGLRAPGHSLPELATGIPAMRQILRSWTATETTRAEMAGLRWLLARSDRPLALVKPDGHVLDTTPLGTNALKSLMFGPRHLSRSDDPALTPLLLKQVSSLMESAQVRLGKRSSARLEVLALPGKECCPLVAVEFFSETSVRHPLPLSRLTPVEREVIQGLSTGRTNKEIGATRGTSCATVKNQVSQILSKLGCSRRGELIAAAQHLPPPFNE